MVKILSNKNKGKMIIAIVLMLTVLGSISYGAFFVYKNQTNDNLILSSCFSTTMTNESASINLTKAIPMSDEEGKKSEPYTFTLTNTCDLTAEYYVIISSTIGSFSSDYISYRYNKEEAGVLGEAQTNTLGVDSGYSDSRIIGAGSLKKDRSTTIKVRVWLNEDADYSQIHGQSWSGQVKVISKVSSDQSTSDLDVIAYTLNGEDTETPYQTLVAGLGTNYTVEMVCDGNTTLLGGTGITPDELAQIVSPSTACVFNFATKDPSGANAPKLVENLIPVVYDTTSTKWKMSSTSYGEWYDYGNQKWANAVTVTSAKRGTYSVGDTIEMEDIIGMWVWIPRYEYKYTNLGSSYAGGSSTAPGEISINFISGTSTTETTDYIIHPAFRNGSTGYTNNAGTFSAYQIGGWDSELTGFWMGKFETSSLASASGETSAILNDPIVKPNVVARRYQTVSAQYNTILGLNTYHGISTMDSHMSKNSEWGAAVYLSQSIYGKYGNNDYSGANKEIFMNNSESYITGRSMGMPSGATGNSTSAEGSYEYDVALNGTGASTTGNIYGIYDMAGGAFEYVMSWLKTASSTWGANSSGNYAGFSAALSNHKYYEEYTTTTASTACGDKICYGHALSETVGWYGDSYSVFDQNNPWLLRGSLTWDIGSGVGGVFNVFRFTGGADGADGMRAVLV